MPADAPKVNDHALDGAPNEARQPFPNGSTDVSRRPQGRRALETAVGSRTEGYSWAFPFSVSRMTSPSRSSTVLQKLKSTYGKWNQVRSVTGNSGGRVARTILDANHLQSVPVQPVQGTLTDHYDPRRKQLRLARENFVGNSVAATAVAAHECGHALQDADDYRPMEFRTAMVPVANAGARFGLPLAIAGSFFGSTMMVQLGVLGYAGAMLLTFLTLPVEFNASKRALRQLDQLGLVSSDGQEGAKEVLRAAAMTYVAGVASSAGYLVYMFLIAGRSLIRRPKPPLPPGL